MAKKNFAHVDTSSGVGVVRNAASGDALIETSGGTGKTTITQHALLKGGASNTYDEITVGSEGQILKVVLGTPAWAADGGDQVHEATNDNASATVQGEPLYMKSDADFDKARADNLTTALVFGLAIEAVAAAGEVEAQRDGFLTLTTGQWDAVTGDTGGLTPGSRYFLSPTTAGRLTTTVPNTAGQYIVLVGIALSTTVMDIRIDQPLGL